MIAGVSAQIPEGSSVLPLLETAPGVWEARALAEAPRVERLAFGSIDFQLDTGIDGEDEELLYARARYWPPASPASFPRSTALPPR